MSKQHHLSQTFLKSAFATGRGVLALVLILAVNITTANAEDYSNSAYTRNLLFDPSQPQLKAEARGRVTIYDGLDNSEVERALNTQFGRIDRMMFVRTRHTLEDGSVEEDDDCD